MILKRILPAIVITLLFVTTGRAQQKYPATFLWRISGKNLTAPSYLYGTMHVQDRRLFYFGDSLYHAIESVQSFAMEIDPEALVDSLMNRIGSEDTSSLLKKILEAGEYRKIADQLQKRFKLSPDKITIKKLQEENNRLVYSVKRHDDMPAAMDLYLYKIATAKNKYTSGIEDVSDQLGIFDAVGKTNVDVLLRSDSVSVVNGVEQMKQTYIRHSLAGIDSTVNEYGTEYKDIILIKRNMKMVVRIDSLMKLRTGFFAVGAAHLPGDSGVISLLRKKGFTVEPVMASRYLAPEEYKIGTANEKEWVTVQDENKFYTVKMPGKANDVTADFIPMKMHLDLTSSTVYGIGITAIAQKDGGADSVYASMMERYRKRGYRIITSKSIEINHLKAFEMITRLRSDQNYRLRLVIKNNQLVMMIFGGPSLLYLYSSQADQFFNSLVLADDMTGNAKKWQKYSDTKHAFSIEMPGKTLHEHTDNDGQTTDMFYYIDNADGSFYSTSVVTNKPGYIIMNDSTSFEEYKTNLNKKYKNSVTEFSVLQKDGMPACRFRATVNKDGADYVMQGYEFRRGERTYVQLVVSTKENADFPAATQFLRSFKALPFTETGWNNIAIAGTPVTTMLPDKMVLEKKDTTKYNYDSTVSNYQVTDPVARITYMLQVSPFSKYYWSKNDSIYFKTVIRNYEHYTDSLVSYTISKDVVPHAEALYKIKHSGLYKKMSLYLNGDTAYSFYAYLPEELLDNKYYNAYFTSINFTRKLPNTIFNNKAKEILLALQHADTALTETLKDELGNVSFEKENLEDLYRALPRKYAKKQDSYQTANDVIANKISTIKNVDCTNFVAQQYFIQNDSTEDIQHLLLLMLAKNKTTASYQLLKKLIIEHPPVQHDVNGLSYTLNDSAALAVTLFPEVGVKFNDTIIGPVLIDVAKTLIDSNQLSLSAINPYTAQIYQLAQQQITELKKEEQQSYGYESAMIQILQKLNTEKGNQLLQQFTTLKTDLWLAKEAVIALLKNKQQASLAVINKMAADKDWRISMYNSLKEINRTDLFPKAMLTQQKFAEGYLYFNLPDTYDVSISSAQFIKTITQSVNGKTIRYYLYQVILDDGEDDKPHLAVCGPFSMKDNDVETGTDFDVYCNTDEPYSNSSLEKQFQKYLEEKKEPVKD